MTETDERLFGSQSIEPGETRPMSEIELLLEANTRYVESSPLYPRMVVKQCQSIARLGEGPEGVDRTGTTILAKLETLRSTAPFAAHRVVEEHEGEIEEIVYLVRVDGVEGRIIDHSDIHIGTITHKKKSLSTIMSGFSQSDLSLMLSMLQWQEDLGWRPQTTVDGNDTTQAEQSVEFSLS